MKFGDKTATTPESKAQLFNQFFLDQYDVMKVITNVMFPSFEIFHLEDVLITKADVKRRLEACDDSCSIGSYALSSYVMKNCSYILSSATCILFNSIVSSCFWPPEWKLSHVALFNKSLIFERILFDYIYPKAMKIIKPQQRGFLKSRSTVSQIITYLDLIYANLDNNLSSLSIYFDIQKAFDSLTHHLRTKLCTLGFDFEFINLFKSYLNDRRQCGKLEKYLSNVADVTSCVPQGSVLCPLFFLLFIDDLPGEVVLSVYFLVCDDLKLHSSSLFNDFFWISLML